MPESFSSILEAIADEGRERMRPFPAEAVHALGHARRKRRNTTVAATAAFVSCAVAVSLVLGTGSPHGARPVTPPTSTPSAKHTNTTRASDGFLEPADVPNNAVLDWRPQMARTLPPNGLNGPGFPGDVCGSGYGFMGSGTHSRAKTAQVVSYEAATSKSASADEGIYTYASDSAAADDLHDLTPDPATCGPNPGYGGFNSVRGSRDVQIDNGFGWIQYLNFNASGDPSQPTTVTEHILVVQRGRQLAFFIYRGDGGGPDYSTSEDSDALQKMAGLLAAAQPTSSGSTDSAATPTVTVPPGNWLTDAELPFAKKFAWNSLPGYSGPDPGTGDWPRFGCQTKLPVGVSAPLGVFMKQWNADQNGGFATRIAVERQYVFASEDQAAKVIAGAKDAARATCHLRPGQYDFVVTTYGAAVSTADSVSYDETAIQVGVAENAQPSHQHEYLVRKGAVVVELELQTNSSVIDDTSGDAAVLAAMVSHLP